MLILYSHILISLKDTAKRIKNARKSELEFQEQNVFKFRLKRKTSLYSRQIQALLELPFESTFLVTGSDISYRERRRRPPTSPSLSSPSSWSRTYLTWWTSSSEWTSPGLYHSIYCSYLISKAFVGPSRCHQSWCGILEAIIGVSIVSNSSINPYIFLLFNSDNSRANSLATRCCLSRTERPQRSVSVVVSTIFLSTPMIV